MARADRLERLDAEREALEAEYFAALTQALQQTAAGKWGLFAHNRGKGPPSPMEATVNELFEMGGTIDAMRERLFLEPFALHSEFLASRGPVSAEAVGEPKQARAWLERLNK